MAVRAGAPDQHNPVAGILWMAGAALCFAASFNLVKAMQDEGLTVFQAVMYRQILGLIIFSPVIVRDGRELFKTEVRGRHFLRAVGSFGGMCCGYYSFSLINVAESAALQFTLPIFTMFCAVWLLGEKLRSHRVIATVIGFCGVLVIVRPGFSEVNWGIFFALAAAGFYASSDTLSRWLARYDKLPSIMIWNFVFVLPLATVPSLIWWVTPTLASLPYILGFSFAGVAAQFCLTQSFGLAEASLVSPVLFLRLPLVSLIAWLAFGQVTELWTWVGAAAIFVATTWMARVETRR